MKVAPAHVKVFLSHMKVCMKVFTSRMKVSIPQMKVCHMKVSFLK